MNPSRLNHHERELYEELHSLISYGLDRGAEERVRQLLDRDYGDQVHIDIVRVLMTEEEPPEPSPPSSPDTKRQRISFFYERPIQGGQEDFMPHHHCNTILSHSLNYDGFNSWVTQKLIELGGEGLARMSDANGFRTVERLLYMDDVHWPTLASAMRVMNVIDLFKPSTCVGYRMESHPNEESFDLENWPFTIVGDVLQDMCNYHSCLDCPKEETDSEKFVKISEAFGSELPTFCLFAAYDDKLDNVYVCLKATLGTVDSLFLKY